MSEKRKTREPRPQRPQRWSARRKVEVVLRLLKGESLEELSRETGKPAHVLSEWRERFLAGGESLLKARSTGEAAVYEEEKKRIQAKLGEVTMENELLREKIRRLEDGAPLARRRSRK